MAEWYSAEKVRERELEKLGEKHAKTVVKEELKAFDDVAYNESLEAIGKQMSSSIEVGLKEAVNVKAQMDKKFREQQAKERAATMKWDFAYSDSEDDEEPQNENDEHKDDADAGKAKEEKGKEKDGDEREPQEEDESIKGKRKRKEEKDTNKGSNDVVTVVVEALHADKKVRIETATAMTSGGSLKKKALPPPPAWILA